MSVWLTIPSARPPAQVEPILAKWKERGYYVALWRDDNAISAGPLADFVYSSPDSPYPGYAAAVNHLIEFLLKHAKPGPVYPEWFVAAGDDTEPDPNKTAEEIAEECRVHFSGRMETMYPPHRPAWAYDVALPSPQRSGRDATLPWGLMGVMQPTGDRWHEGVGGFANAPIDRVCGSAWYGREYCRRMYGGDGPLYAGYRHMFVDEEAQEVAIKMGVFWQRRDLVQKHCHWGRGATDKAVVNDPVIPPHLVKWNTPAHWQEAKTLFLGRKAAGFPGHEPIP